MHHSGKICGFHPANDQAQNLVRLKGPVCARPLSKCNIMHTFSAQITFFLNESQLFSIFRRTHPTLTVLIYPQRAPRESGHSGIRNDARLIKKRSWLPLYAIEFLVLWEVRENSWLIQKSNLHIFVWRRWSSARDFLLKPVMSQNNIFRLFQGRKNSFSSFLWPRNVTNGR